MARRIEGGNLTHLFSSPRLRASARYFFLVAATPRWVFRPNQPLSGALHFNYVGDAFSAVKYPVFADRVQLVGARHRELRQEQADHSRQKLAFPN